MTPRRSVLYLPASNPRAVEKARTLPCDVVVLDLEDAVGPDDKAAARSAAVAALRQGGFQAREVGVRVNGLDTDWGDDDLAALGGAAPAFIVAPKVSTADHAAAFTARLPDGAALWAMIETPRALFHLDAIAATPRLGALMLGVNDLAAMLRCAPAPDREPLKTAMSLTVAAARAHGLAPIDGVFNALDDEAGFEAECRQGRLYGFEGKSLIHPRQIAPANAAFSPSAEEIAWAEAVVEAFDDRENRGRGVLRVAGAMVERLHLSRARDTLALRDLAGTL
ncbi:CoA ester lyase [Brevundimonas sp.]|uniref:HpcH/HpaI aldolase/citrate lyase family protein n=1 Tax=Brevundimonas sp. TaxID=1871086 RepID=UPI001DC56011|nr:CoA ester lyase [Brevundimonas sp.]MBA4001470.1 CoA ester lyase [Brevundimonas sp.]